MERFNKKGMMIYPNPRTVDSPCQKEKVAVVEKCFCHNGHSLISDKIKFDRFSAILFKASRKSKTGLVALSPVYGCYHRVSFDLDFVDDQKWTFSCPECNENLLVYTQCECGAELTAFFTSKNADFHGAVAICNRVGCHHAKIFLGDDLLTETMLEAL